MVWHDGNVATLFLIKTAIVYGTICLGNPLVFTGEPFGGRMKKFHTRTPEKNPETKSAILSLIVNVVKYAQNVVKIS